jgi:hypothetical protein
LVRTTVTRWAGVCSFTANRRNYGTGLREKDKRYKEEIYIDVTLGPQITEPLLRKEKGPKN